MIDMETEIFNEVSEKVREQYPDIFMTGEYVKTPPSFPCYLSCGGGQRHFPQFADHRGTGKPCGGRCMS